MAFQLSNFASSTLTVAITAVQLTIQVVDASAFTPPSVGDVIPLVIEDVNGNTEIVYASALSGDTFTITRGEEGTAPAAFTSGSRVECRLTAAVFASQLAAANIDGGTF